MTETNREDRLFRLEPWNRGISDEDLLADLGRVAAHLDRDTVTYAEYDAYGRCASRTLEVRFGGWNRALSRAGLRVNRQVGLTRERLFENLQDVWIRLGRQPRQHEMVRPLSVISKGTYSRHLGTWRKALEEFVAWVNAEVGSSAQTEGAPSAGVPPRRGPRAPSLRLRFFVMKRDGFRCSHCGRSPARDAGTVLHVDHIKPWSDGGETIAENLQTLCEACNLGKANLTQEGAD